AGSSPTRPRREPRRPCSPTRRPRRWRPSARRSSRNFKTGSRGRGTRSSWGRSRTCSSTARARIRRSRSRAAPPARRPRSTASSTSAAASSPAGSRACPSPRSRDTSWSASAPSRVAPADRVALIIATAGGAGWVPVAPGTVGSALTVLVLWLVPFSRAGLVVFFVVVTLAGTWAAHRAERVLGRKDPGAIVIDEVAGMTLSVLAFPLTLPTLVTGFLLFRVFDTVKPFPARASQRVRGGLGVMVDDLIA